MSEMPNDNKSYTAADFRAYAEGRMLPAERHALEKAALEDPFLADALEGYQDAIAAHGPAPVNAGLDAAKMAMAEKTKEKPAPVIPMRSNRYWAAAAVVAVLVLAGWFLFTPSGNPAENTIAVAPPAPVPNPAETEKASKGSDTGAADIASNLNAEEKQAPLPATIRDRKMKLPPGDTKPAPNPRTETLVTDHDSKLDVLEKETVNDEALATPKKDQAASAPVQAAIQLNSFEGRVTDLNNNPLANATVRIANTNSGVVTNNNGYFNLKSADTVVPVEVTVIGYATQNTQLRSNLNFQNTIKLPENKAALSEVVVVTKPAADRKKEKTVYRNQAPTVMVQDAEPASGWIDFDTYLQKAKAFTTAQQLDSGDVVISFLVDRNGKLSSFRIEQSLSEAQDAEAERLIKAGPAWRLLKGRKARATVIIHF